MVCANCGMKHEVGQNKLCNGPFVTKKVYDDRVLDLHIKLGMVLNEFKFVLSKQPFFPTNTQEEILNTCQRELERET